MAKKATIVEFLERTLEASLDQERDRFLRVDRREAQVLLDAYSEQVVPNDFHIPERRPDWTRPFIWEETTHAGLVGGSSFIRTEERALVLSDKQRSFALAHPEALDRPIHRDKSEPDSDELTPAGRWAAFEAALAAMAQAHQKWKAAGGPTDAHTDVTDDEIWMFRKDRLRTLLLMHHQVILADQLPLLLGGVVCGAAGWDERFASYINFLADHRALIEREVLVVCSDTRVYRDAPINTSGWGDNFRHLPQIQLLNRARRPGERPSPDELAAMCIPGIGGLLLACSIRDADPFVDDAHRLRALEMIDAERAERIGQRPIDKVKALFRLSPGKLELDDFINIRFNDDAFGRWRDGLAKALATAGDEKTFRLAIAEALLEFNTKAPQKFLDGTPKTLVLGFIGGLLGMPFTGLQAVLGGTVIGVVLDLFVEKIVTRNKKERERLAQNAAQRHFHAMLVGE